jgi:hypothetical protein
MSKKVTKKLTGWNSENASAHRLEYFNGPFSDDNRLYF